MSILDTTREETFNNYLPRTEIDRIRNASDKKNDTDSLTFSNKGLESENGVAFKSLRERNSDLELEALSVDVNSPGYYDKLLGEC